MIGRLTGALRHYAWGSHDDIARLQGRPSPTAWPEAELWLGAHALAPATLELVDPVPLDAWLRDHPEAGGPELCFLLKVLAVARPLSIQTHPDDAAAAAGFAREEALGIPLDAPNRVYRDDRGKPELVLALTPFRALVGFRPEDEILALLDRLASPALDALAAPFRARPASDTLRAMVSRAFRLPLDERSRLADEIGGCCRAAGHRTTALGAALAATYPGDIGLLLALLLNPVEIGRGEALYLAPGVPHSYLSGTAVEVMGCSDNTIRGGLTPKHVALDDLLAVLRWDMGRIEPIAPEQRDGDLHYPAPTRVFSLSTLQVSAPRRIVTEGPEIWWVAEGAVRLTCPDQPPLELPCGHAALVDTRTPIVSVQGSGWVFRARGRST